MDRQSVTGARCFGPADVCGAPRLDDQQRLFSTLSRGSGPWLLVSPLVVPPIAQPADLEVVRSSYDRVADNYVAMGMSDLTEESWLRAALAAFGESVRGLGPVLDVGCGHGAITAHLAGLGVDVSGVDLSPKMIDHARRLHPGLDFAVASATDLAIEAGSLGGILGWWSLFNLPREVLPEVLSSFARALVPGGHVVIGTHVGTGDVTRTEAYGGIPVMWTTHLWQPAELVDLIAAAGLEQTAQLLLPASGQSRPQVVTSARRTP